MKLAERTFQRKLSEQHGRCFYCGELLANPLIEIDHILPFSIHRNGQVNNLCLSCRSCNRLKGDKTLAEFKIEVQQRCPVRLVRGMLYFEFLNLYPNV
jgi:CRISPR/Cas system Type II protein with McrA/HNH and RuvC-like nuclease domain